MSADGKKLETVWLINQYASTPETGMGGRHYYLARELEKLGYRVRVIAASYTHLLREPPTVRGPFGIERREGINIVWVKVPHYAHAHSKKRIFNWCLFALKLPKLARVIPEKPDVVLYSSPSLVGYLGAEYLARKLGVKLIFEVRDIWPLTLCELGGYSQANPFIRLLQIVENRAYRNADVVVSNLKYAYLHMVRHGLSQGKFYWIPNGVSVGEAERPAPLPPDLRIRRSESDFIVGYAGTLGLANNMTLLVGASLLLSNYRNIMVVIVGGGKEKENLERMADKAGIGNITFIDPVPKEQIQSFLKECDALFLSVRKNSLYNYGIGLNKLYDYLYAGKPILYAAESGDYHPVKEGDAGLELSPEDPVALADAIMKLYRMPASERNKMGQNGRKLVLERYEYGILARQLAEALGVCKTVAQQESVI